MSFRVSALAAVATVLGLASITPASAQPRVPARPRYSGFSGIFTPGQQQQLLVNPGGGFGGQNAPGFVGPGVANPALGFGAGYGYPGGLAYPQVLPGAFAAAPELPPSGIVGTFNNRGHWYGGSTGNYGHWYPNGIASGVGVLGAGGGGLYGGAVVPNAAGGFRSGGSLGAIGGTALGIGVTANQFRR